jgi:hypothetical protein
MPRFVIENMRIVDDNLDPYAAEPVTIAEIKEDLQLSGTDFDATLNRLRRVARQTLENNYNVSIVAKRIRVVIFVPTTSQPVPLPMSPVANILAVRFKEPCGCGDWRDLTVDEYSLSDDQHVQVNAHGYYEFEYLTEPLNNETMLYGVIRQAGYLFSQRDMVAGVSINPMLFSSSNAISPIVETSCSQYSRARF